MSTCDEPYLCEGTKKSKAGWLGAVAVATMILLLVIVVGEPPTGAKRDARLSPDVQVSPTASARSGWPTCNACP